VRRDGNVPARELVAKVFRLADRKWRGIGEIPASGLALREEYADFDAERRFSLEAITTSEPVECRSGDVLTGRIKPYECAMFGTACTPERPMGAPMVSTEGACAAYFNYGRARARPAAAAAGEVTVT
jgi:hydrogenase expression/formation protein HypD